MPTDAQKSRRVMWTQLDEQSVGKFQSFIAFVNPTGQTLDRYRLQIFDQSGPRVELKYESMTVNTQRQCEIICEKHLKRLAKVRDKLFSGEST